ncbi:MAG: serine/threonine protein phosphatase [Ignavibacteriales bacterium]|nr:serine/threonine protein phosphatase [Ignavibacteriales bacterium]
MFAIIGDIHGCFNTLKELHSRVKEIYGEIDFYATGDLVDRGNHSPEVIDYVIDNEIHPVLGNHDRMFLSYFTDRESVPAQLWVYNNSAKTIYDYEQNPVKLVRHLEFISSLPLFYDLDEFFLSHAGFGRYWLNMFKYEKKIDLEMMTKVAFENIDNDKGLLWNRTELLDIGKIQVVGHTPVPDFKFYKKQKAYYIDTGASNGNKLTALVSDGKEAIDIIFEKTDKLDISSMIFR